MIARRLTLLSTMLATAVSASRAQSAIYGAGLQAWTGCWAAQQSLTPSGVGALVCISPTANVNVAQVTIIDGNIVSHETIDATGRPFDLEARGCTGTRRATWSRDSRRLFLRTTGVCQGVPLVTSGIFSISTSGAWLDVQGIRAGSGTSLRVTRYRDVGVPAGLPQGLAASIQANVLARGSTRTAFGAPVHLDDVIDAMRLVDADVVAAWILERAQQVDITESELALLSQAGLPLEVADALAAVTGSGETLARANADSSSHEQQSAGDGSMPDSTYTDYYPPWYTPSYDPPSGVPGGRTGGERGGAGQRPRDNPRREAPSGDPRYPPSTPDRPSNGDTVRLRRPRG